MAPTYEGCALALQLYTCTVAMEVCACDHAAGTWQAARAQP